MNLIRKEIEIEMAKPKPNVFYVNRLESLIAKGGELDLETFRDSGKFIHKEIALKDYGYKSKVAYTDVVRYMGDNFIEVDANGKFIIPIDSDYLPMFSNLERAEQFLFKSNLMKHGHQAEN